MHRTPLFLLFLLATPLAGQAWVPGDSLPLIRRALLQRTTRDADTALAGWRATAHGVVRSSTILTGEDGPVERPVKRDEITVEVYGEIPNRSKQVIARWRDTSYLPNRIRYHRDHLGIVANDFGETIRLGDGDEVRNLVHPLSQAGLAFYRFRAGSTIEIASSSGILHVVAVDVRPADPEAPGTVGTLYLDVDRAALVRFRFTFTPAAYIDRTVRDITVMLESALQERARWLPWRQSIVIRREDPFFELPSSNVIRADWELSDYVLGVIHPPGTFTGLSVTGPPFASRGLPGAPPLGDGAPPRRPDVDVDAIQQAASAMLEGRVLDGLPGVRSSLAGFSDFLHVDRAGGITLAYGVRFPLQGRTIARLRGGIATASGQFLGAASLEHPSGRGTWRLTVRRELVDIGDAPVTSPLFNSLATAITGNDQGDWTLLEGGRLALAQPWGPRRLTLELGHEWSRSMTTRFQPLRGESPPNPALGIGQATVARVRLARVGAGGSGWSSDLEGGTGDADWLRVAGRWRGRLGAFDLGAQGGWGSHELPGYRSYALGGTGTLPGLDRRAIGGRGVAMADLGYRIPVSIPVPWRLLPYGRFVRRVQLPSTLVPFVAAGAAWGDMPTLPWRGDGPSEPVAGLRLDLWASLLRVETGVSLRHGGWGLAVDLHPDWWIVF